MKQILDLRMAIILMALPLLLAALFVLVAWIQGLNRFDPAYFTPRYIARYEAPGAVARDLEGALQTGDAQLMAELQGMRHPRIFEASPKMIFTMLWERRDRFVSYMYFDMNTYHRHMHYFEQVGERWVVSPTDFYFHFYSGEWLKVFLPVGIAWWILGSVAILVVVVFRLSARMRENIYGGPERRS